MAETITKYRAVPEFLYNRKVLIQLSLCSLFLGILYFPVFKTLVRDWMTLPDFSHGFFIPIISLYLVWERSDMLDELSVTPKNLGVGIVLLGLLMLTVGTLAAELFTMRFSFLLVISGIILFLLGWSHFKVLLFPIVFLVFMIPIPSILLQKITFPLQLLASKFSALSLQQIGIPVFREGNIINLPSSSLEVAEACSGIRSLISLLALSVVFAYFTTKVFWQRVVLVLSCIPIAIFVNSLRIIITAVLTQHYGLETAQGFFHTFSGFLLFFIALVLLVGLSFLLTKLKK